MARISVLHFLWHVSAGGAERAVTQLVLEQMADPEVTPAVALGRAEGRYCQDLREAGVPLIDLGMSSGHDVVAALRHAAEAGKYGVHHFHSPEPALFLTSLMSGTRCRVYTQRGGSPYRGHGLSRPARSWMAGFALRHFWSGFSGNTRHAARMLAQTYRLPVRAVQVTYNGVDFGEFRPRRTREAVRKELSLPEHAPVIGSSGKLLDLKRNEILIRTAAILHEMNVHVVLVGDGPEHQRLLSLAERLGVGSRCRITGMTEDVASYVQAMDVFVLASNSTESFANALVEAMGLGIACVACSDSPGPCEHIDDGLTGFVCEDLTDLAMRVKQLLQDDTLRAAMGPRASRAVHDKYTLAAAASRYKSLYLGATQ